MTIASNRFYKQDQGFEKEVSFFDIETWGRLAEACSIKGKKGRGLRVVGRLKQSRWHDPEGKTRYKINIVAEHVEFRPEFKKDGKPTVDVPYDDEFDADESNEPVLAMAGKELEAVAF